VIYEPNLLNVIYNTLLLIKNETDSTIQHNIIDGLTMILYKNNQQIKEWIKLNLIL